MSGEAVMVPVATGELFDKLSILEIKAERIGDPARLLAVEHELRLLAAIRDALGLSGADLDAAIAELKAVNEALWAIEDDIREHEARADFGPSFIALARSVYRTNDRRAELKRAINLLTGSSISEQKSYKQY